MNEVTSWRRPSRLQRAPNSKRRNYWANSTQASRSCQRRSETGVDAPRRRRERAGPAAAPRTDGLVFTRGLGDAVGERVVVHPDAGFRQVRCGGDAAQLLSDLLGE
ncbi:hypothetical protein ASD08_45150 [Streptomyces sp. Root369]|nr:hypothetical protein ASD08_45150 [Streptomyces sp. Root369]